MRNPSLRLMQILEDSIEMESRLGRKSTLAEIISDPTD